MAKPEGSSLPREQATSGIQEDTTLVGTRIKMKKILTVSSASLLATLTLSACQPLPQNQTVVTPTGQVTQTQAVDVYGRPVLTNQPVTGNQTVYTAQRLNVVSQPIVAQQTDKIILVSPDGNLTVTNFPSFAIN